MGSRAKRTLVVSRHGKYPFQTGMVTATLLRRGLPMGDAIKAARGVRDAFAGKGEVTTGELSDFIEVLVGEKLGIEKSHGSTETMPPARAVPMVDTAGGTFPFSKGVIVRHLDTAGVGLEAAAKLVDELLREVASAPSSLIPETEVHERVEQILARDHGTDFARRYHLTTWSRQSDQPLVILIGGATGTGKSTLAMELAYRLGVHWVTSTDLVRETMRAVVLPDLAPGLHDHSFRGMLVGGQVLSDPKERVIAGFRQQAAQVAVGIKAVVRRAITENAHVIIEGIHLEPPFEQYLPPESPARMAGFLLVVPEEREHRARFRNRSASQPERAAVTYLDAFQSVRWIQSDLMRLAEDAEAVVLASADRRATLTAAVDILSRGLHMNETGPSKTDQLSVSVRSPGVPTLILIIDGLGDEPSPVLGDKTPLAAAETPTLDRLAAAGGLGRIGTGRHIEDMPSTDEGLLALLAPPGEKGRLARGLFEALGQGLPLPTGAVLLRGNLATVEPDGAIVDRRAGRIREGVEDLLAELQGVTLKGGIVARVFSGHEHRVLVMLLGAGLCADVCDTDPGSDAEVQRVIEPRATTDSPEAARAADALRELMALAADRFRNHPVNANRLAEGLLPANALITRGAAMAPQRKRSPHWDGAMVARCNTALGVARYLGLRTATSQKMTGNLDTDLDAKFETAGQLLNETECVVVHVKGADVAAHDRRPVEKRGFISATDAALGRFLRSNPQWAGRLRIVVCADHGTSSISGDHISDPVPLLLATWDPENTERAEFNEDTAASGALGLLSPGELPELLGLTGSAGMSTLPKTGSG